jgi:hypothetical protein
VPTNPNGPDTDLFPNNEDDAKRVDRLADVTSRILAKHAAMRADRGPTTSLERARQDATRAINAPAPRPDVVLGIITANGWVPPGRENAFRDFFFRKGVTQVLKKNAGVSTLLIERGLLSREQGRELELTLADIGIFPRFRIACSLGHGLVGRTYRAVDLSSGVDVAFKVFREPDLDRRKAFLEEYTQLKKIRNRHVAPVLASGASEDACFTCTSLALGEGLSRLIEERRVESEIHAVRIALKVAEGLAYVHTTAGLSHLGLHPGNVWIKPGEGGRLSIAITDFRLARHLKPPRAIDPAWRAPECERAAGDMHSDFYAVGAILYNLLGAIAATLPAAQTGGQIDLAPFRSHTREFIYTATDADPTKRHPDYRRLIAALSALLNELGHVEPDDLPAAGGGPESDGTRLVREARQGAGGSGRLATQAPTTTGGSGRLGVQAPAAGGSGRFGSAQPKPGTARQPEAGAHEPGAAPEPEIDDSDWVG